MPLFTTGSPMDIHVVKPRLLPLALAVLGLLVSPARATLITYADLLRPRR